MFSTQEDIWVYSLAVYTQRNTHTEYTCINRDSGFAGVRMVGLSQLWWPRRNYCTASMLTLPVVVAPRFT